jgi:predicted component of type VI protein secretion system
MEPPGRGRAEPLHPGEPDELVLGAVRAGKAELLPGSVEAGRLRREWVRVYLGRRLSWRVDPQLGAELVGSLEAGPVYSHPESLSWRVGE